ncbi:MAG: PilZ domain-containing protein [Candidatus Omnitrophica bacterium]|nr:PilZ domain-containing protein [Candidatus Omnitrophota bacterium]
MNTYKGPERRKFPRVSASLLVSCRTKEKDFDLSQSENLSNQGILLLTRKKYQKGQALELIIRLPVLPANIKIDGEVVYSRRVPKDIIYATGVKFYSFDQELVDFISSRS